MANNPQITSKSVALVLTGGGARGAYQAGVAKGLSQIFAEDSCANPISIISGMSAGSINGSFLACGLSDLPKATKYLSETWSGLTTTDIFRSDPIALGKIGLRLISDVTFGSLSSSKLSEALLDTRPLGKLLRDRIPFERIDSQISAGHLHGLAVSAYSYSFQRTAIFYQAKSPALVRDRARRKTRPTQITDRHVMASAAIPVLFPPIEIDGHFFGDGSLRATAPFSPALRLGADKMMIVGVKADEDPIENPKSPANKPSFGEILGTMLNSLFFDSTEADMEKLTSINHTLKEIASTGSAVETRYRPIDILWLKPSIDLGEVSASLAAQGLPTSIRYLLGGLGSENQYSEIASYLLFDSIYTSQLIDLGYSDTIKRKAEVLEFLSS